MKTYTFETIIKKHQGMNAAYVEFPYDAEKEFGARGRIPVKAVFDNYTYRGSLVKMGGDCYWIGITQAIRQIIGKNPGDTITVSIEKDEEIRTVEVPEDFKKSMEKDKAAMQYFENLSYTHRREYVSWINEAKRPETRLRRIEKAMEMLKAKKKEPR